MISRIDVWKLSEERLCDTKFQQIIMDFNEGNNAKMKQYEDKDTSYEYTKLYMFEPDLKLIPDYFDFEPVKYDILEVEYFYTTELFDQ